MASDTPEDPVALPGFPVNDVQFSPDGKYLATALLDNNLQLHDVNTGEVLHYFRGHAGGVTRLDFSNDGALLASGGADGTVRLWNATSGIELDTLETGAGWLSSVAFSPDGKLLAAHLDAQAAADALRMKGEAEAELIAAVFALLAFQMEWAFQIPVWMFYSFLTVPLLVRSGLADDAAVALGELKAETVGA